MQILKGLGAVTLCGAMAATMGCASDEEKICKKMVELLEQEAGKPLDDADKEKCEPELKNKLASCSNRDEVVECYKAIQDFKGALACEKLCKGGDDKAASGDSKGAEAADSKGCPNGAECMNRCNEECRSKHGNPVDTEALRECSKSGGSPDECAKKGMNEAFTKCFRDCRGLD